MSYDFKANIQALITRYTNKIEWLKERMNEDNEADYDGIIEGLEIAIQDLGDMLDGLSTKHDSE